MERMSPLRALLSLLALGLVAAGCRGGGVAEIKQPGVFIDSDGYLVEIKKLGTLGTSYGPRVYPELPEYDVPSVTKVSPIYVNLPELATAKVPTAEDVVAPAVGRVAPERLTPVGLGRTRGVAILLQVQPGHVQLVGTGDLRWQGWLSSSGGRGARTNRARRIS